MVFYDNINGFLGHIIFSAEMMTGTVWADIAGLQDPELRHLAESLPTTILRSRADSTVTKYAYACRRWKS